MDYNLQFDEYLKFDRKEAYLQFNDKKNRKVLKFYLYLFLISFSISLIVNINGYAFNEEKTIFGLLISLAGLILSLIFISQFNRIFSLDSFRKRIFSFIIGVFIFFTLINTLEIFSPNISSNVDNSSDSQIVKEKLQKPGLALTIRTEEKSSFPELVIIFVIGLSFFAFTKNELIQLFTLAYTIPLFSEVIFFRTQSIGTYFVVLFISLLIFIFSYSGQAKRHKQFLTRYDYYYNKSFETIRMKKELDYAREIQLSMLPAANATIGSVNICALSEPAMEVGGDYFDYFKISENEIGVFICDVSGHGVASALLLSGLRSSMHVILEDSKNPKYIFEKLNRMIRKTQSKKMFVTAIFGVINTATNKISLFNAGHLPPYKIDGKSNELLKISRHGVTLGALDEIAPETLDSEVTLDFEQGDKLFFYTDGLSEAMDTKKNEFGFENIERLLYSNLNKSPSEILNAFISGVNNFSKEALQQDDMTIVVISRI